MSASWNPGSDFPDVIDGVESVFLHRLSGGEPLPVDGALRRGAAVREVPGGAAQSVVRWHLPVTVLEEAPAIGDRLVDSGSQTWTIVEVHYEGSGRWLCVCRNLTLVQGLSELIDIERAVWTKDAAGAAQPTWHPWQTALAARIVPRESRVSNDEGRMHMLATHQVLLATAADVDQDCRVVGANGAIYRILVVRGVEQLDALYVLDVLLETQA